jgi:hypothetical protein
LLTLCGRGVTSADPDHQWVLRTEGGTVEVGIARLGQREMTVWTDLYSPPRTVISGPATAIRVLIRGRAEKGLGRQYWRAYLPPTSAPILVDLALHRDDLWLVVAWRETPSSGAITLWAFRVDENVREDEGSDPPTSLDAWPAGTGDHRRPVQTPQPLAESTHTVSWTARNSIDRVKVMSLDDMLIVGLEFLDEAPQEMLLRTYLLRLVPGTGRWDDVEIVPVEEEGR